MDPTFQRSNRIYSRRESEITPVVAGANTDCDGLSPRDGGIAVFQSVPKQEWAHTTIWRYIFALYVPALQANTQALVIKGCFSISENYGPTA